MSIEFSCPGCQKTLRVSDEHAGKQARCPQCQTIAMVPGNAASGAGSSFASFPPPETSAFNPVGGGSAGENLQSGQWRLRIDDGREFGPVDRKELDQWMAEGRVTPSSQVQRDGETNWRLATELYPALASAAASYKPAYGSSPYSDSSYTPGASVNPFSDQASYQAANPYASPGVPSMGYGASYVKPHRGGQVLTFGILGFMCCFAFAIAAWVMGASDLREMRAGVMDPSGRGLTQAGMIIGIVGTVLGAIGALIQIGAMVANANF